MQSLLITGASSGIGRACALYFAGQGWRVFAGVRQNADAERLRSQGGENLTPLFLDVTQAEQISEAAQIVAGELEGQGLTALINNAGIAFPGPLAYVPLADLEKHLAVNVTGQIAVTQAFLPLLRRAGGRVVMMSSMGGKNAIPFFGAYCGSKFALEGISDALRLELRPLGVRVIVLEPGAIDTPIWEKSAGESGEMFGDYPPSAFDDYGKQLQGLGKSVTQMGGASVETVVAVVERALTVKRPKARYALDNFSRLRALIELLPTPLRDRLVARQIGL